MYPDAEGLSPGGEDEKEREGERKEALYCGMSVRPVELGGLGADTGGLGTRGHGADSLLSQKGGTKRERGVLFSRT